MLDKKKAEAKQATYMYYGSIFMFVLYFGISGITLVIEKNDKFNFNCGTLLFKEWTPETLNCACVRY
jgi:hypothetical protein